MTALVQSVARASAIIRILAAEDQPTSLAQLSSSLGLPKTTTHGLVQTLREVGFVDQDAESGRYAVGAGLIGLGATPLDVNVLRAHALNWTDALAARAGESALLAVLDRAPERTRAVVAHHVFRPDASTQAPQTGTGRPLHASALGKVLLAHDLPAQRLLLDGGLDRFTRRTVVEPARCERELAAVRDRGWAAEVCEAGSETAGIAAPVLDAAGSVVAAVGVEGHVDRVCDTGRLPRGELVERVLATAGNISRSLARAMSDVRP